MFGQLSLTPGTQFCVHTGLLWVGLHMPLKPNCGYVHGSPIAPAGADVTSRALRRARGGRRPERRRAGAERGVQLEVRVLRRTTATCGRALREVPEHRGLVAEELRAAAIRAVRHRVVAGRVAVDE